MNMSDKINGKFTTIEMEMMIEEKKKMLPYIIEENMFAAKFLKAKYENLITVGFTEKQAMEIIKTRPLYE